jgi:hypothetical protein
MAEGEWLWIAEADDVAEPDFLSRLAWIATRQDNICFAFCDSRAIDEEGSQLWGDHKDYYRAEGAPLEKSAVFQGQEFARRFLSVKNLLVNVSAVLWRREALISALDELMPSLRNMTLAADWKLYLHMLTRPNARVAYEAAALNGHRRHSRSVTRTVEPSKHLREIRDCQAFARSVLAELPPEIVHAQRAHERRVRTELSCRDGAPRSHNDNKGTALRKSIAERRGMT